MEMEIMRGFHELAIDKLEQRLSIGKNVYERKSKLIKS